MSDRNMKYTGPRGYATIVIIIIGFLIAVGGGGVSYWGLMENYSAYEEFQRFGVHEATQKRIDHYKSRVQSSRFTFLAGAILVMVAGVIIFTAVLASQRKLSGKDNELLEGKEGRGSLEEGADS